MMDDHTQQDKTNYSFAVMTSLVASGPWPTWPFQTPTANIGQTTQKNEDAEQTRQTIQWPPPPHHQRTQHIYSPKDSTFTLTAAQTQRTCSTTSPSPSPNPDSASTLAFNVPSTPATTAASYSTPASSSTTNPSNRRPRPPSLNIPLLWLSVPNSNESDSPTAASAASMASAASLSSDSDAPAMLEETALPLLLEALDPQLWSVSQPSNSTLLSTVSTDSSALSSPSTNSIDSVQSFQSLASAEIVQSAASHSELQHRSASSTQSLSHSQSAFPNTPQLCLSLADNSTTAVNPLALSIAVTQALQQIPATAHASTTPTSLASISLSNSTAASPLASTSTSQTSSSTSSPQLPLRMLISEHASPTASVEATDSDSAMFLQNREAAAAFLRCMPLPTPKRRSTIHTCSPAMLQSQQFHLQIQQQMQLQQQLQLRPSKALKLDNNPINVAELSRQMLPPAPAPAHSNTDKVPTHLPVPFQAWQSAAAMVSTDSQPANVSPTMSLNVGSGGGDSGWYSPSRTTSFLVTVPSSSLVGGAVGVRALSPQPPSLLALQTQTQTHSQHFHGLSASNGSRMSHSLVANSKRMKHPVAGEPPLA